MPNYETTLTLPADDQLADNQAHLNQGLLGDGMSGNDGDDLAMPGLPSQGDDLSYQDVLDQNPDMHPELRGHVEALLAKSGDAAQMTDTVDQLTLNESSLESDQVVNEPLIQDPEHFDSKPERIVPDISERSETQQDLIEGIIGIGETAIDADQPNLSPKPETPPVSDLDIALETEPSDGQGETTMSAEERREAATKWIAEHTVQVEPSKDDFLASGPTPRLEFAQDEAVPAEYSSDVALQLLNSDNYKISGQFEANIDKFSGLNEQVFDRLLQPDSYPYLAMPNIKLFKDLKTDNKLADKVMEAGYGYMVLEDAEKFGISLDGNFAQRLVESGNVDAVTDNIERFTGVDLNEAFMNEALRDPRNAQYIAESIDKFQGVTPNDAMARRIVSSGGPDALAYHLDKFSDLSNGLFRELASQPGSRWRVFKNIESFPSVKAPELVSVIAGLAESGDTDITGMAELPTDLQSSVFLAMLNKPELGVSDPSRYGSLNNEVADRLISMGRSTEILQMVDRFPDFKFDLPFAQQLSQVEGYPGGLVASFNKFPPELHDSIAELIVSRGYGDTILGYGSQRAELHISEPLIEKLQLLSDARVEGDEQLVKAYREIFPDADANLLATRLVKPQNSGEYSTYELDKITAGLESLSGLDQSVASIILANGGEAALSESLASFTHLDADTAEALIGSGHSRAVIMHPEKFDDFSITAGRAMEVLSNDGYSPENSWLGTALKYMDPNLPPEFNNELAAKLVEFNGIDVLVNYFENFKDLDKSIAEGLILHGDSELVLDNFDHFTGTSQLEIAKVVIEKGQANAVLTRLDSINGLETLDSSESPLVERFQELLKDKELVALIGKDGPLHVLSEQFLNLYMQSDDPHEVSTQLKALADGNTSLWRINHQYAKLLVGEVGRIGFLDAYMVDAIPMALPRKDISSEIPELPSPVKFVDMDEGMRRMVLSQEYIDSHPDIMSANEISFTDLNGDCQDTMLAYRLYETIATTRDSQAQAQASERNKAFAEAGNYWQKGDLAHATSSVSTLRQILLSGILCGETIGSVSGRDSYPFNVDTVTVSDSVLEAGDHKARTQALQNAYFGSIVLLLHRTPESVDYGKEMQGGSTEDHRLVFGAVAGTEVSAILLRENYDVLSNEIIDSVVESGIYIPVVDQSGKTILTYEDYQKRRADGNYVSVQPQILDSSFKREGTQGGSNEGAMFVVPKPEGGVDNYYVKFGDASPEKHNHLWTEILADKIYRAVTPELVPDTQAVIVDARLAKASKMVEVDENAPVTNEARNAGFIMDSFLGNWDAVYNSANLVMSTDGRAMRIDTGNGLDFRAQGARKLPNDFSTTVREVEVGGDISNLGRGMRQRYPGLTDEQVKAQVTDLRDRLPDEMIDSLVDSIRRPKAEREELARILKARKQYLVEKFL